MALDASRLGADIVDRIETRTGTTLPPASVATWLDVASAVVAELQGHAEVSVNVNVPVEAEVEVASVSGVTIGIFSSGPGTGTAEGTAVGTAAGTIS